MAVTVSAMFIPVHDPDAALCFYRDALGLDHTLPKADEDNFVYALDGDKLQFLMQADNTKLSHLEKKRPSLRRTGQ